MIEVPQAFQVQTPEQAIEEVRKKTEQARQAESADVNEVYGDKMSAAALSQIAGASRDAAGRKRLEDKRKMAEMGGTIDNVILQENKGKHYKNEILGQDFSAAAAQASPAAQGHAAQANFHGQGLLAQARGVGMTPASNAQFQQQLAINALRKRAQGEALPSHAELALKMGNERNMRAMLSQAAGSTNPHVAQRNAVEMMSRANTDTTNQVALQQAQEQRQAEAQMVGALQGLRGQDQQFSMANAAHQQGLQLANAQMENEWKARQAGMQNQFGLQNAANQQQMALANMAAQNQNAMFNAGLQQQTNLANQGAGMQQWQMAQGQQNMYDAYGQQAQQNMYDAARQLYGNQNQYDIAKLGYQASMAANDTNRRGQDFGFFGGLVGAAGSAVGSAAMMSDKRLKKDIKKADRDAERMMDALKAYSYNYRNTEHGEGRQVGVMAQDLEKSEAGRLAVVDLPQGKGVTVKAIGPLLAASSNLHKRLKKLEKRA